MPEPRSMVSRDPPDFVGRAGQPQNAPGVNGNFDPSTDNLGRPLVNIPFRLRSGAGIAAEYGSFDVQLRLDIEPLQIAQGAPNEQWIPCWVDGDPVDVIRRVPVAAIPQDAPFDSIVYGRLNGSWVPAIENVTISWPDITDKPDTFPPTLPIPSSGVTGLDAHLIAIDTKNSEQDGRLGAVETKNATQDGRLDGHDGAIASNAAAIAANNSAITGLGTTKMDKPAVTPAGQLWNGRSDGVWVAAPIQANPPNDGLQYARKGDGTWAQVTGGAVISDTPPASPLPNSFWWESDTGALHIRYDDGSSTQWVQVNAAGLADAPADGGEYVRINGVWRLKHQSLNFAGQTQVIVPVPTGAQRVRWDGGVIPSTAASQYFALQVSLDGTTFMGAAADYTVVGWARYSSVTPTAVVNFAPSSAANIFLSLAGSDASVMHVVEGALALARNPASGMLAGRVRGYNFQTTNGYQDANVQVWVNNLGSAPALKALRFFNTAGVAFTVGTLNLDWGY